MFFTSSPLERAVNLQVVDNADEKDLESDVTYELSSNYWIIKAYSLNYKTSPNMIDGYRTSDYLRLPATKLCADVFVNFSSARTSIEPKVCGYSAQTLKKCIAINL